MRMGDDGNCLTVCPVVDFRTGCVEFQIILRGWVGGGKEGRRERVRVSE